MCGAVPTAIASFKPPFDCIPRALDEFEASGLERGDDVTRNRMVETFQPAVRVMMRQMINTHRIPIIVQDHDDILSEINVLLLTKTFGEIRKLKSRHKARKPGRPRKGSKPLLPVRGPGAKRSARVVRKILVRAVARIVQQHVHHRLNDYPNIDPLDIEEVFERYASDQGKAAREVELDIDREEVNTVARSRISEHLRLRRRSDEAAEVAAKIANIALWERYQNCDALAADWS